MKIWKSNLQGFLEEAIDPIYLVAVAERGTATLGSGAIEMITFVVDATGFNAENRPLGLRVPRPAVPSVFESDVERERQASLSTLHEFQSRLEKLGRTYRDGMISDKPIAGELD